MKNLTIIDVSSVIYSGRFSITNKDKKISNMPIGGVLKLLQYCTTTIGEGNDLLLAFDSSSFRKKIFPDYKKGRTPDATVEVQKKFVYDVLMRCGIPCHKVDNYEADDIVAWAVSKYAKSYYQITIVCNDMDLAHNVQQNVVIKATREDMPCVNMINFKTVVHRGDVVPFNTISAYKVFNGCTSDKIPPFTSESGEKGDAIYRRFTQYLQDHYINFYENSANKDFLVWYLKQEENLSESDMKEISCRIVLVYPAACPADYSLDVASESNIDLLRYEQVLSLMGDYSSLKCLGLSVKLEVPEDLKALVKSYGQRYVSGEFSVDNNLPVDNVPDIQSEALDLDFLKEFD